MVNPKESLHRAFAFKVTTKILDTPEKAVFWDQYMQPFKTCHEKKILLKHA